MTVDELIEKLTEMPGYRPVMGPGGEVDEVEDAGTYVRIYTGGFR